MTKRIFVFCIILVLFSISSIYVACTGSPEQDIALPFAKGVAGIANSTYERINSEVKGIDSELDSNEIKLSKLDHVAAPALAWVEYTKDKAQKELWGGTRVIQVTQDLAQMKNNQFSIVKLQLTTTLTSGGMKFDSVIHVEDLSSGTVTPLEDLRDELESKIAELSQQREAKVKEWGLVQSTLTSMSKECDKWKITRLDSTTYQVAGPGLGWSNGLTRGEWFYYTDTEKPVPAAASAQALEKVLKGEYR